MIRHDLAHAARSLWKDRGFAFICIVSLGIGIGAVVALSLFGRFLTAPAIGINTEGLTELLVLPEGPLRAKAGVWALDAWSYPDYRALDDANTGMTLAGWVEDSIEIGGREVENLPTRRAATYYISDHYFSTFGVSLEKGPGFDPIDYKASGDPRVVVSHEFWKFVANSDPDLVGKTIVLDGVPHTVVGITREGFQGHFHFIRSSWNLIFLPLERHPRLRANPGLRDDRNVEWVHIHGRLKPSVTLAQANSLVSAVAARLSQQYPATNQYKSATVERYATMGATQRSETRRRLGSMIALAASVLLIVCVNISGMMLVRAARRERELCIRAALGAERRRLIQHLFFEALWLAIVASGISTLVLLGIPAIVAWKLAQPLPAAFSVDVRNLLTSGGLCLLVSVSLGLLPALRFSRPNLSAALKEDAAGGGRQNIRVHRFAAVAQIGIAVPFLVISGVMIDRARIADYGYPVHGIAGARVTLPKGTTREAGAAVRRVRASLAQASGVRSVALADGMPIDFDYREFRVGNKPGAQFATAHVTHVAGNFLETLNVPLVRGRTITEEDGIGGAAVAVISQSLAKRLFPSSDGMGEPVTITLQDNREETYTVVGVCPDFATSQLTTERPQILVPLPETLPAAVELIVRGGAGDEPQLKSALENALRELGVQPVRNETWPGIVVGQDLIDKSNHDLIAEGTAVGVVGGLVLVLAALGIIGVVGFMVATRTKEIAVRMALGSTRLRIFGMMLTDIVKLVVPGVAAGLVLAAILIRTLDNVMGTPLTVGPEPLGMMEPVIYVIASAIAVGGALLAGVPAARRATSVQPMTVIRTE